VILLYPVVLVLAGCVVVVRGEARAQQSGGWTWFLGWCVAGAVYAFSFVSGLSIGLLIFPFAAALLLGVAWYAPSFGEALGLLAGLGLVLLLVAWINRGGDGVDPGPWLVAGICCCSAALAGYSIVLGRRATAPVPPPDGPPDGARAPRS
jgi:hypothetical protein